ncbi:MAG: protein translocase subunit SecD [Candidatus Pacebacteria bacterium]|nr:protein translocase subunit SecD [Candidatus Paceibacterota bacterium]
MWKARLIALILFICGLGVGFFVYSSETSVSRFPFKLGLDLAGGTHLVYSVDTTEVAPGEVADSMSALRDVVERRVNLFGVAEPIVQTEKSGVFSGVEEERLIVELPGVTNTEEAIALIGKTPTLEFKLLKTEQGEISEDGSLDINTSYEDLGLTGRYLKRAALEFGQGGGGLSNEPVVVVTFNDEGKDLFASITREHVGEIVGIFLDGQLMSSPVVREEIPDGTAVISGNFTPDEARELVKNLNYGALPMPIALQSTQTIGASLGSTALEHGVLAGILGLLLVAAFLIVWYRIPGILGVISLGIYVAVMLSLFKLIPITLTAAGVAGFILSIGMAVDANILIFERMRESLKEGKEFHSAVKEGFDRAWRAIRDGNISSIITATILFWFGTSLVQGFALTFGIGVMVSMLTAIMVSRSFLSALGNYSNRRLTRLFFGSGTMM